MHEDAASTPLAEAEYKIRLTAEEFAAMPAALVALGFTPAGDRALRDDYLDYRPSPVGGWDYTRLRTADGDRYVLAEKRWTVDAHGHPVRLEEERTVTREEAEAALRQATIIRTLQKRRWTYHGTLDGRDAEIVLDALEMRGTTEYFLECELRVPPEEFTQTRRRIVAWMGAHLPAGDFSQAPSMLQMLLSS